MSKLTNKQFRQESTAKKNCPDVKKDPTYDYQESCHKIPNKIIKNCYNDTSSQLKKNDLKEHNTSSSNILYSGNNNSHTKQENDLQNEKFLQTSIKGKGPQITKSIEKLHNEQSTDTTAALMRQMRKEGPGYNKITADFDERKLNRPTEKQQIDIARRNT